MLFSTNHTNTHFKTSSMVCRSWFKHTLPLLLVGILSACGGGNGSLGSLTGSLPDQPQNFTATIDGLTATLSWDAVSDASAYEICKAEENISDSSICTTYSGGTLYQDLTNNSYTISDLSSGSEYYFTVTALNSDDNDGTSSDIVIVTAGIAGAVITGELNDTGVITCSDYAFNDSTIDSNGLDCSGIASSSVTTQTDSNGDPIPRGQDADYGRDVEENDDSDGYAGFSYTKIDSDGYILDSSASSWSCVKDNVTGLIWEVKTDDGGLHDTEDTYGWYNTDTSTNGGYTGNQNSSGSNCYGYSSGTDSTYCNTEAFVARVNNAELCGASDWRMPLVTELASLVGPRDSTPFIDSDFFPNSQEEYWAGQSVSYANSLAFVYTFAIGRNYSFTTTSNLFPVRLVRGE